MQPSTVEAPPRSAPGSSRLFIGVIYFFVVPFIVPIGSDFYRVPLSGKWALTGGHLVVLALIWRPEKGKPWWVWTGDVLVTLFALLQLLMTWLF